MYRVGSLGLTACVFDAISNFNLPPKSPERAFATTAALNSLSSACDTELPALVRFLLDGCSDPNSSKSVLAELREKLNDFARASLASDLSRSVSSRDDYDFLVSQNLVVLNHEARMSNARATSLSTINVIVGILRNAFQARQFLLPLYVQCIDGLARGSGAVDGDEGEEGQEGDVGEGGESNSASDISLVGTLMEFDIWVLLSAYSIQKMR